METKPEEKKNEQLVVTPVIGSASISIPKHKHLQQLVNTQVDINRAVWAGNLMKVEDLGSCTSESNRDQYVQDCIKSAFDTLKKLMIGYQLDLDL
jgi:hypothetical protein